MSSMQNTNATCLCGGRRGQTCREARWLWTRVVSTGACCLVLGACSMRGLAPLQDGTGAEGRASLQAAPAKDELASISPTGLGLLHEGTAWSWRELGAGRGGLRGGTRKDGLPELGARVELEERGVVRDGERLTATTSLAKATWNAELADAAGALRDVLGASKLRRVQRLVQSEGADGSLQLHELENEGEGTTVRFEPALLWMPGELRKVWQATTQTTLEGSAFASKAGKATVEGEAVIDASGVLIVQVRLRIEQGNVTIERWSRNEYVRGREQENAASAMAWGRVSERRTLDVRALGVRVRGEDAVWKPLGVTGE